MLGNWLHQSAHLAAATAKMTTWCESILGNWQYQSVHLAVATAKMVPQPKLEAEFNTGTEDGSTDSACTPSAAAEGGGGGGAIAAVLACKVEKMRN